MEVPFIVFAGSFPRQDEVQQAKASGARVLCFASTDSIAERMIDYGADGLILEGSEAGGHIGHVSTMVLIQQVLFRFPADAHLRGRRHRHRQDDRPPAADGRRRGADGHDLRHGRGEPGPPGFQGAVSTRPAPARRSPRPQYDSTLPVVAVRALKNKGTEDFGKLQLELIQKLRGGEINRDEAQYEVEKYWVGALRRAVRRATSSGAR